MKFKLCCLWLGHMQVQEFKAQLVVVHSANLFGIFALELNPLSKFNHVCTVYSTVRQQVSTICGVVRRLIQGTKGAKLELRLLQRHPQSQENSS